ncbi:MAG: hypothetical protein WA294_15060 [Acidobacteriaceae bacterium]
MTRRRALGTCPPQKVEIDDGLTIAIAELERNLIVERVRAGMRRARLEGQHIGRTPLDLDRAAIRKDNQSLGQLVRNYGASRTTIHSGLNRHAPATQ